MQQVGVGGGGGGGKPKKGAFAHVRVKRGRTTAFVEVALDCDGVVLRTAAAGVLGVSDANSLRLLQRDGDGFVVLDDNTAISKQKVVCDSVLVAVLQQGTSVTGGWEQPDMQTLRL